MKLPFCPMKKISAFTAGALLLGLCTLQGCAKNDEVDASITNIAVSNPDFQLLEDAAVRGDVAGILGSKNPNDPQGNYTVFAPTNSGFNRLGVRTAIDFQAIQPAFLRSTLLYHVFSGTLAGAALAPGSTSPSALGPARRIIRRADGSLYVNGSKILATDVKASNGLVHPIDKVLLATGGNVVESAVALSSKQVFTQPELSFLVEAVLRCNLQGLLSQPGPYTVFAPTDQAFKDAGFPTIESIRTANVAQLTAVLANHVLANSPTAQLGDKFTPELPEGTTVTAFSGQRLVLGPFANGTMTVRYATAPTSSTANMVIPDVQCTNGVVHVIDRVLK